jgi:hypothetical protein
MPCWPSLKHGSVLDGKASIRAYGQSALRVRSRAESANNQWDWSRHAFEPADAATFNWCARLRAISLGDSSNCAIQFLAALASAVPDRTAPITHTKKPTHSNTKPELSKPLLTWNAGREVELLIMFLLFERIADRDGLRPIILSPARPVVTLRG